MLATLLLVSVLAAPPQAARLSPSAQKLQREAQAIAELATVEKGPAGLEIHGTVALHSQIEELDALAAKHGATNRAMLTPLALRAMVKTVEPSGGDHSAKAIASEEERTAAIARALGVDVAEMREVVHPMADRRILATRIAMASRAYHVKGPLPYAMDPVLSTTISRKSFRETAVRAYQDASRFERDFIRENWNVTKTRLAQYERAAAAFDDAMLADLAATP